MMQQVEPRLEQLLADPMIQLVMASDQISNEDWRGLARRLSDKRPAPIRRDGSGCRNQPQ